MAKKIKKEGIKIPTFNSLSKKYGDIMYQPSKVESNPLWIPTRCLAFNYQCGDLGALAYGKIIEVYGEESSGKSLLAYDFAYCVQQMGGIVIWVDAEDAWDNAWAEKLGIDLEKVIIIRETCIEIISDSTMEIAIYWRSILTNNEPILLVTDSVAAMECQETLNTKMTDNKSEMAARARAFSKMFRLRSGLMTKLGITQVYINQAKKKLSVGFSTGDDTTTPGGSALKFYASIRVMITPGAQVKDSKKRRIGKYVSIRCVKNKIGPPKGTISKIPIVFNDKWGAEIGFSRYFGLLEILEELGVVSRKGSTITYKGKTIARGEDSFMKVIEENDDLRKRLIRASGINTISKACRALSKVQGNLFPVEDTNFESQMDYNNEEEDE